MPRQFADVLRELGGGETMAELTAQLDKVAQAVRITRKSGEITLTLSIKASGENAVLIDDRIKAKVPEIARPPNVFFVGEGGITRNNPLQRTLPLHAVSEDKEEALGIGH